jgi:hypothetical protein
LYVAALVAAATAGCAGDQSANDGAPQNDCGALLVWRGVTYEGAEAASPPALGKRLGKAVLPRCGASDPKNKVVVVRIEGIHPSVALVAPGPEGTYPNSDLLWLGPGYLTPSPLHPLHEEIRAAWGDWHEEAAFHCTAPRVFRARARETPAASEGFLRVTARDRGVRAFLIRDDVDGIVTVDEHTVVVGFRRHGIPFVGAGDKFELTVRECEGKKEEPGFAGLRRLLVTRLQP